MSEAMDTDLVELQSSAEIETGKGNSSIGVISPHVATALSSSSDIIKDEIMEQVEPIKSDTTAKVKQKQQIPSNSVTLLSDDINKNEEKLLPPLKLVYDYDDDENISGQLVCETNLEKNMKHESNPSSSSFSGIKKRSNSSHQRNYRSSQEHLAACSNSEDEKEEDIHQNKHEDNNYDDDDDDEDSKEMTSKHENSLENGNKGTDGGDGDSGSSCSNKKSLPTYEKLGELKPAIFNTTTRRVKTDEDAKNSNDSETNQNLLETVSSSLTSPPSNENNNNNNNEPIFSAAAAASAEEDSNDSEWVATSAMDSDDIHRHENNNEGDEDGDAEDNGDRESRRRRRRPPASTMQRLFYQVRAHDDEDEVHFEEVRAGSDDSDSSSLPVGGGHNDADESTDSSDCILEDLDEAATVEPEPETPSATGSTEQKSSDSAGPKPAKKPKKKYETPNVLKKPKPKYNWISPKEMMMREVGYRTNRQAQAAQIFRSKFYGSLYSVERLELMKKLDSHHGCVNCLNFNFAGTKLASGSDDLFIKIWNYGMGKVLASFHSGHRANVFQAKFLPLVSLDTMIVSCARDNQVRLSELNSTGEVWSSRKLAQHRGAAHKLSVSPQTPHIVLSCGEDSVVYNIDVREDKAQRILSLRDRSKKIALYSIHQNPLFPYEFCVSGRDEYVRIYDSRKLSAVSVPVERGNEEPREATNDNDSTPLKKFCPHHLIDSRHKSNVTAAMYNYNGREIVASYNDENIYLFDATHSDGADCVKVYEGHRNSATIKGINFFGDKSQFIVSGSDCGHVFIWDKETESIVNFFRADENGVVNCLEPHPTCPILATSGLDDDVKIWIPSKEKDPVMGPANADLASTVYKNLKARKEELERQPESMDGRIIQALWNHIRQANRERRREAGLQLSDSDDSPTYNDDDEDDDDSGPRGGGVECAIQ